MAAIAATIHKPIRVPKPAALPMVGKGPPLLEWLVAMGLEVGGSVGVMVMVVSIPEAAVMTEVIGVADHDDELEDELLVIVGTIGGTDVLLVKDVLDGIGVLNVDDVLKVDVVLDTLEEVGFEDGADGPNENEDPPGIKSGLDGGAEAKVEDTGAVWSNVLAIILSGLHCRH